MKQTLRWPVLVWTGLSLTTAFAQPQDASLQPFEWDTQEAAHLMRRAGFSASPDELQRLVDQGFAATLDELLHPETVDDPYRGVRDIPGRFLSVPQLGSGVIVPDVRGMQTIWLASMQLSKRQLLEKMTLFWHDHFATSVDKVQLVDADRVPAMWTQHLTLREHALGNFKEMVRAISRDPAMLFWLDNVRSRKEEPNENWARELLELFTMGEGSYTQRDIEEAARAFTGWTVDSDGKFQFNAARHDSGPKTFLGVSGNLDGDDIIDIVFQQPVTADFIAAKLWEFFAYPDPDPRLVNDLGRVFRESGYDIRTLMSTILRHPEFHSQRARRALVKSPVEFTIGFVREMELARPPFSLLSVLNELGQSLFRPPDVDGWTSGVGWLNTSTLLARYNYINGILSEALIEPNPKILARLVIPFRTIVKKYGLSTFEDVVRHFSDRMMQGDISPDEAIVLQDYMQRGSYGQLHSFGIWGLYVIDTKMRGLVYLISLLPAYQLN